MNKKVIIFKKTLVIGIFILFFIINTTQSIAMNNIKKSNLPISNRDILYVGGTGENNHTTIQEAIYNASFGDTIFVYDDSSPYIENIRIFKSITLVGENKNTTIIDGGGWGNVLHILTDRVNIKCFTITNGRCGVLINSNYNTISHNLIKNNIDGINLGKTYNNIDRNSILNNVYGIYIEDSSNNTIKKNIFLDNIGAIFISKCSVNELINNNISNNNGGIIIFNSNNITINSNKILKNNYGVYIKESMNNTIKSNDIILNNQYGIWLYNSSYNKIILNNNITNNNKGIRLKNFCNYNLIYQNNFINNTENAHDECNNIWDNGKYGNYWSNYKEKYPEAKKKTLKPWIWNIPYEIDGGSNHDNCPLTNQWSKIDISTSTQKNKVTSNKFSFWIYLTNLKIRYNKI